jgi:hypothetical protein
MWWSTGTDGCRSFNALGELVPAFWETMRGEQTLNQPIDIAVASEGQAIRIYVNDGDMRTIGVFDAEGHRVGLIGPERLSQPLGIAAADGALYVGDNDRRRVLAFQRKAEAYELDGEAGGYVGSVAALAFDGQGSLLVHTGSALAPVRLTLNKGHRAKGVLWEQGDPGAETGSAMAPPAGRDGATPRGCAHPVLRTRLEQCGRRAAGGTRRQ